MDRLCFRGRERMFLRRVGREFSIRVREFYFRRSGFFGTNFVRLFFFLLFYERVFSFSLFFGVFGLFVAFVFFGILFFLTF